MLPLSRVTTMHVASAELSGLHTMRLNLAPWMCFLSILSESLSLKPLQLGCRTIRLKTPQYISPCSLLPRHSLYFSGGASSKLFGAISVCLHLGAAPACGLLYTSIRPSRDVLQARCPVLEDHGSLTAREREASGTAPRPEMHFKKAIAETSRFAFISSCPFPIPNRAVRSKSRREKKCGRRRASY